MSRGKVFEIRICPYCNRPTMRTWPVRIDGSDRSLCLTCLRDAADRGGFVEVTEMGGNIEFLEGLGPGPDDE